MKLPTFPYHTQKAFWFSRSGERTVSMCAHVCACGRVNWAFITIAYVFVAVVVAAAAFLIVQAPFILGFCVCLRAMVCVLCVNVCIFHVCVHAQSIQRCFYCGFMGVCISAFSPYWRLNQSVEVLEHLNIHPIFTGQTREKKSTPTDVEKSRQLMIIPLETSCKFNYDSLMHSHRTHFSHQCIFSTASSSSSHRVD